MRFNFGFDSFKFFFSHLRTSISVALFALPLYAGDALVGSVDLEFNAGEINGNPPQVFGYTVVEPGCHTGERPDGSSVQRNFLEIGWQQVKLPCELTLQEAVPSYRALGSVSAAEPNYAVAPILPSRRDASDPIAGLGNIVVPPSVEDGAPGSTEQLPTRHSAVRTASAPTPITPNDPKFNA
jgi:hypothetical protein